MSQLLSVLSKQAQPKNSIYTLLPCALAALALATQSNASEVVFRKELSLQEALEVTRSEIPYNALTNKEADRFLKEHPKGVLKRPEKVFRYDASLLNSARGQRRSVWSKEFAFTDFGVAIPSDFVIFDVCISHDILTLLYKERINTVLEQISLGGGQQPPKKVYTLMRDSPANGKIFVAGKLGPGTNGVSTIEATYPYGKKALWVLGGESWTEKPIQDTKPRQP
jgi:hypothetical protein